jgi:ubiquinone/menaquinone biosynthesis C-methylase UbiE
MHTDPTFRQRVRDFWNLRATLGEKAGSDDVIAKQLEIAAIAAHVRDGMSILEIGCGNGCTALEIAERFEVDIRAMDFAEAMIQQAARLAAGRALRGRVGFEVGDVLALADTGARYDLVYTERALINLPDFAAQAKAIAGIMALVAGGGAYVMCENSQDGLDRLNALRQDAGLNPISPPWHNRYFRDADLERLAIPGARLERVDDYSSTYYFLSRVVNAWDAAQRGVEPRYDSPINQLALRLPSIGQMGQGRVWLWRRTGDGSSD